jgi:hypothetical protein
LKTITYATPEGDVTVIAPATAVMGDSPVYRPVPGIGEHAVALRREFGGMP